MDGCYTDCKTHEMEFKWTIKKFSHQLRWAAIEKRILYSDSFTLKKPIETTWKLEMHLFSKNTNSQEDFIGMFIVNCSGDDISNYMTIQTYFIVNSKGERIKKYSAERQFKKQDDWGFSKFYEKKQLMKEADIYLPNDELTIICQLGVIENCTRRKPRFIIPESMKNDLANDFSKLLKENEFSDITFVFYDEEIEAHKTILSARSPVFKAMFQHQMKEKNENMVEIDDIKPEVFQIMLQFIYTNDVSNIKDIATDLFRAADKYQLDGLKLICLKDIIENLSHKNAAEILILADIYDHKLLMQSTIQYINMNVAHVIKSPGYEFLAKSHPHLLAKLFEASA